VLSVAVLFAALSLSAHAAEVPRRGDYPRCQEECLDRLKKTMNELSGEYERTENRLLYEKRVEQARGTYDDCIDACRERYPVK
jgi:hypothetical protein